MSATMQARPTTYAGVKMRSRLEAGFAQWLDRAHLAWSYEPRCYASKKGQWLPDFEVFVPVVNKEDADVWLFDVKPQGWRDDAQLRRWTDIVAESDPGIRVGVARGSEVVSFTGNLDTPSRFAWVLRERTPVERDLGVGPGFGALMPMIKPPWAGEWWKGV